MTQGSAVEVDTVLIPVDGSEESTRAVQYAVAIAKKYDARVHALYLLGEQVVKGIESGVVDEDDVIAESDSFLESIDQVADQQGVKLTTSTVYGFSTVRKTQHPGSVILDCAEDIDADFIVVPREPVSGEPGEILEKAAEYVLLYASQPVLSV